MKHGADRHKWDLITDVCEDCGLQKRKWWLTTKDGRRGKGTIQFFVNGKWEFVSPPCKKQSKP